PLRFRPERFLRHGISDRGTKAILHAPPFSTEILQEDFHVCRHRCFYSVSTRPCAVSCISFAVHVRVREREALDTTGAEVYSDDQSQQGLRHSLERIVHATYAGPRVFRGAQRNRLVWPRLGWAVISTRRILAARLTSKDDACLEKAVATPTAGSC